MYPLELHLSQFYLFAEISICYFEFLGGSVSFAIVKAHIVLVLKEFDNWRSGCLVNRSNQKWSKLNWHWKSKTEDKLLITICLNIRVIVLKQGIMNPIFTVNIHTRNRVFLFRTMRNFIEKLIVTNVLVQALNFLGKFYFSLRFCWTTHLNFL